MMHGYDIKSVIQYEKEAHNLEDTSRVEWSSVIFVPFHPAFRLFVLFSVIVKSVLGPIQGVYPIIYCSNTMDLHPLLTLIKYYYWYCCDTIYGADTFLHIVHRQVTDKAMRREYLPKSAFLILLDLLSLVPLFRLVETNMCPAPKLWPNLLAFNEFLVIYRGVQYFSLGTTHSFWMMCVGYTIIMVICLNCVTCLWLLLTFQGLCDNCESGIYDWRSEILYKLNETNVNYTTYVYGFTYMIGFVITQSYDAIKPHTVLEFNITCFFILCGYMLNLFIVFPKAFSEAMLRFRTICERYPDVTKHIEETRRRNSSPKAYEFVEHFYVLMWKMRSGITCMPAVMETMPRYMRLEVKQDLVWQLYYHSPTLRKTSNPFKRGLCENIKLEYKLPGEKFFTGSHSHTNVYYIKSGVVQLISADDGTTPILSFTGGTILGDVNFLVPPNRKNIRMQCLTYCELIYIERKDILQALVKYPNDSALIMKLTKERLEHGKTLYACKQHIRGLERSEDQGIAWIIKRWWEISEYIRIWTKQSRKSMSYIKCEIPPEETIYHCAKYIGQLVLSTEEQLQTQSMFVNVKFPWILTPDSAFVDIWHRIVFATVFVVLVAYPPNLTRTEIPTWFAFVQWWTNFIYGADICMSLLTCPLGQVHNAVNFTTVLFARFKSYKFMLDVLSAIWTEHIAVMVGLSDYYYTVQSNRLLKTYVIFFGYYLRLDIRREPLVNIVYKLFLITFIILYFSSYAIYELHKHFPETTISYFFGSRYCNVQSSQAACDPGVEGVLGVFLSWIFELMFLENTPRILLDIYIVLIIDYLKYFIYTYFEAEVVVCLYLHYRDVIGYQHFVTKLKYYYSYHKIHRDLLARLERYLVCHWNYYRGKDVMKPNMIREEPHEIYWRSQGEVALKLISESKAFLGADPALVQELAHVAQFMILPSNSSIFTFGAQCKMVTWIVQGSVKCEYHDDEGELLKMFNDPGQILSVSSIFLGKASLRTYTSETDCEILYIRVKEFYNIMKRYPEEWSYFKICIEELRPEFDEMFHAYVLKHRDYQHKLRSRLYSTRMSTMIAPGSRMISDMIEDEYRSTPYEGVFWGDPNTNFMKKWLLFRAITVIMSIICSSMQGTLGATLRWPWIMVGYFCDCIAFMDIVLKLCLGYYNKKGILVTHRWSCFKHYMTRGFILDFIGAAPMKQMVTAGLVEGIQDDMGMFFTTVCKFAHLYIVAEYFNYISDTPVVNKCLIMILKWQVINVLLMIGACQFLIVHCIDLTFGEMWDVIIMERLNMCWVPKFLKIDDELDFDQLHLLFIESFSLVQSGYAISNTGRFYIDRNNIGTACFLIGLGIFWWFVQCYTLTLLVLETRGNTMFQHDVYQLKRFLEGERVDKKLIHRAVSYFRYTWMRTKGVNIHPITYERIGVVFRQDLSFYFYRRTFMALDTILGGGEALVRQLASVSTQIHFLPAQEIIREMDVSQSVFIVHRGKVIITKEGDRVINLVKGCIFGQLEGTQTRPIRVTVTADEYVDLLSISIKKFQEIINDQVRNTIANSTQAKYDFMAARKVFPENPYDTIQYILRGRKTIQLPRMRKPVEARNKTWYSKWLFVAWFVEPFGSSFIVVFLGTLPPDYISRLYWVLGVLDFIHFCNLVSEFFTITVTVEGNKCVKRREELRHFKCWKPYVDAVSLLTPLLTIVTDDWKWQLARLLRLRLLHDFQVHFCRNFKSNAAPIMMKIMILCLLFHGFTCGWIYVACRNEEFPIPIPDISDELNSTINYDQWVRPSMRKGGCPRLVTNMLDKDGNQVPVFVVPKHWQNDYIVALSYVIMLLSQMILESVVCLSIRDVYYKVVMTFIIYLIDIWIISIAINTMYAKLRELYYYDYNVINLMKYLKHNGLSPVLSDAVVTYAHQLWRREKGNWLPELVYLAPDCLREDLFDSLYMYHLDVPSMYQNIPHYFKRQMAARMKRFVIFPGKCIVREGDIYNCTYFIHEGEVEKWFTDINGDNRFQSLLYTNGFFGILEGLNYLPFQFSYYTRTVVDLVYLNLRDWQDLIDSYPDVKRELERAANEFKKHLGRQKYGKNYSKVDTMAPAPFIERLPRSLSRTSL